MISPPVHSVISFARTLFPAILPNILCRGGGLLKVGNHGVSRVRFREELVLPPPFLVGSFGGLLVASSWSLIIG